MHVHAPRLNCTYLIWFWFDSCCCVTVSAMNQCSCLRNIEKMFVNNTDNTVNFMKKNIQVIIMIALLLTDTIHKHIN